MSANNLKCFHCPDCSKEFSKEKTLIKHFKVHSSGKSYRCKMCYSVYPSKRQYNEHKKTHLENEYSTCSECEKQVLKTSLSRKCCDECNLKPKKYLCEKCGKAYDSLMGVRFHIQKGKHTTLFSQCFSCGLTFQSNMALFFHLTQHLDFNIRIVEASEENVEYSGSKSGNLEVGNRSLHLKLTKPSKMTYSSQEEENGKTNNESSTQASMSREMKVHPGMILADKTDMRMKMPSTVAQQGVESIDGMLTLHTKVGQERAAGEHYINLQVMSRMNNMLPAEKMQGVTIEGNSVGQQAFVPHNTASSSCHVTLPQERGAGQVPVLQDSAAHTSIPSWNMIGLDNAISQEKKVLGDETLMLNSDKCRSSKQSGIPQEINLTQYGLTNWKREWQQNGLILQDNSAPLQVRDKPQNSKDTRGILNREERLIYEKMFGSELNMERSSTLERTFTQVQNIIKDQAGVQDKMTLHHGWTNDYCNALFNGMYAENTQLHQRMKMGNTVSVKDKITEEHFSLDFEVKKNNELGIYTIKEGDIREKNEVLLWNEKGITEENSIQNRHSRQDSKQLQNDSALRGEFEPDYDQASWTKSTVQAENGSQMYHHKLSKNDPLQANKIFSQNMRHDLLLVSDIKNETLLMYKLWLERKKGAAKDSERQEKCSNNFLEMLNLGSEEKQKLKLSSNPTKNYLTNSHNFDIRSAFHVGIQCANNENAIFSMADKNVCNQFDEKWSTIPLQNSIVTGGVNVEDYINHLMWH